MKHFMQSLMVLTMIGAFGLSSHAQENAKKSSNKMEMSEPSKEQRSKMANAHEQMATCLRSDKTMKECHQEMRKSCKDMGDQCPMMMEHYGMGKMKHGKMHEEEK